MRRFIIHAALAGVALSGLGCGQGGRPLTAADSRDVPAEDDSPDVIIDPVGELLEPVGLGYRVDTVLGEGPDAIRRTAFGVDGLPVQVDVDGDPGTGNALGAEIQVHFFTLLLYARLQVDRLDGVSALPLAVDVQVLDPRNLLGLPGLLGVVDPDLRAALGMEAREAGAPQRFVAELLLLDSLFEFLPRFTSAQYTVESEGGGEALGATLALFADRAGNRADALSLETTWHPAVSTAEVDVELAPDALESSVVLTVSEPAAVDIALRSNDGLVDEPTSERDVDVALSGIGSRFELELSGVDEFESVEGGETRYRLITDSEVERLQVDIVDRDSGGSRLARGVVQPLPVEVDIRLDAADRIEISTSAPIADIAFAQSRNAPIVWGADVDPDQPFVEHVLRSSQRDDGTALLQARLGGLESLSAQLSGDLSIDGLLAAAPFAYREDSSSGFTQARLGLLPGRFSVRFPEDDDTLRFSFDADAGGPGLEYERQEPDQSTVASIVPLPASFALCAAGDDSCGSNGRSTDASIDFRASGPMGLNYRQRSRDGRRETAIDDMRLERLVVNAGTRSGGSSGYVYFDTQGKAFSGSLLQRDGDSGMYLSFSEGTFAQERVVRYKNFVQVDERSGKMQCPGREELEVRSGGVWYDLGFVLDQLCQ